MKIIIFPTIAEQLLADPDRDAVDPAGVVHQGSYPLLMGNDFHQHMSYDSGRMPRRVWRANVLLLKAKLEFIDGGDTTLEREFMPYLVMKGGKTLGDFIDGGGLLQLTGG